MKPILCLFLLVLTAGPARAQPQADEAAERQRIAAARSQAEAEFAAQERACYARFAVNDCIDGARAQRRAVLADLRRQEVALNDAERKRRAADKLREIETRQAERAAEQSSPRPATPPVVPQTPRKAADERAAAPPAAPATPRDPTVSPQQAQENARRHQARVQQALEHKAKVQKKAAENQAPRRPLPVPP